MIFMLGLVVTNISKYTPTEGEPYPPFSRKGGIFTPSSPPRSRWSPRTTRSWRPRIRSSSWRSSSRSWRTTTTSRTSGTTGRSNPLTASISKQDKHPSCRWPLARGVCFLFFTLLEANYVPLILAIRRDPHTFVNSHLLSEYKPCIHLVCFLSVLLPN